ncbi:MAG: flagellar export chaperone FliS [Phycisphaeraceae bacterium]|nr:flagellar export chaperone FliS [Phycisphaeraceae bacterium]
MAPTPADSYLRTKILTANPEELRMMLYDGAIRFCRQGRQGLDNSDFEASYHALMRAQKIVLELSTSLDHNVAPELCERLSALYIYIYRLLVEANLQRQTKPIDEALKLLEYEKETWQLLMDRLATEGRGSVTRENAAVQGAQQTAISSLSTSA